MKCECTERQYYTHHNYEYLEVPIPFRNVMENN